ncbi:MAG: ammonia-forming cytochrome c nitrite reductase subunit c552, partial [Myxococcota bacterium]
MKHRFFLFAFLPLAALFLASCQPAKPCTPPAGTVAQDNLEPADWGKLYPVEYSLWQATRDPKPVHMSTYKKGWDTDLVIYDKLSEFPYMGILFNGWGFGVEYNEPRGHHYMVSDQLEVDPSRIKAGGVCLTCKTTYATKLKNGMGEGYFMKPYGEVLAQIPDRHRKLGVMCNDCHNASTMGNRIERWTLKEAAAKVGRDTATLTSQELRSAVCAQCHVTYVIPKDSRMHSTGVFFPWDGSKWGGISIENIIKTIRSSDSHREWKQKVTGLRLGFVRHPEFEFYSNNSVHWKADVACADCHMPYRRVGQYKVSDHDV